jgi:galactokinase
VTINLFVLSQSRDSELDRALICQKCEHLFAGVPCGVMDQLVVVSGSSRHAVCIDCRTYQLRPAPLTRLLEDGLALLVCNSHVYHELAGSEYALRKQACERVTTALELNSLRDCTLDRLQQFRHRIAPDDFHKALHVLNENDRTERAMQALADGDHQLLGRLMFASHASLRELYQVSCDALDELVELARSCGSSSVLGARMTGGGFGGCVIVLVKLDQLQQVCRTIGDKYTAHELKPDFYVFKPVDSASFQLI